MVKLFKFMKEGKVVGVTYSDNNGNVTSPEGATSVEITEYEKASAITQQRIDEQIPTPFYYSVLLPSLLAKFTGIKAIQLAPYLAAIEGFCNAQNFVGLRDFAQGMITASLMTTDDYNLFNIAMKEQGIDLDALNG